MRASRWGLYDKYLAQNKMMTVKVYFCSGKVIDSNFYSDWLIDESCRNCFFELHFFLCFMSFRLKHQFRGGYVCSVHFEDFILHVGV